MNAFIIFLLIGITCAVYDLLVVVPLAARLTDDGVATTAKILTFVLPPILVIVFAVSAMVASQFGTFKRLSDMYNKFYNAVAET